jgi:hypothetical protein
VFKSAIAAVAQQHFGAGLDAAHLPGHFASTANALESLAFEGKDALLVIDDYAPTGRYGDDRLENVAERLFRAAGNQQGRSRMTGNGRVKSPRPHESRNSRRRTDQTHAERFVLGLLDEPWRFST